MKSTVTHARTFKRREFLRIVGAGSVAGLAAFMLDRADRSQDASHIVTETRLLMGTVVNLTLITPDRHTGQAAIDSCLQQMASLEAILSRHQPTSQLSRLNRDGLLASASPHLLQVLLEAQRISELTDGAFDVTVKPLVDLYQNRVDAGQELPSTEDLAPILELVDYRQVRIEGTRVWLARKGMGVTLDGIAKGYVVDQGLRTLRQWGFANTLVEAGGDLAATGSKAPGLPWRIGIQAPRKTGAEVVRTFSVTDQAVATSGDYLQPYSTNLDIHHILDPKKGVSSPELASATVIADNGTVADALATALVVMGPKRGLALIESLPSCEAYLVGKDLRVWHSSGFVTG